MASGAARNPVIIPRSSARSTQCTSGFYTAAHDTVEKALNHICELTAAFIGYTPSCPSGLFTAAEDTVKKALDKICVIQAHHIGFEKPCNTAAYEGAAVSTVADALKLLCGLSAAQVLFDSEPFSWADVYTWVHVFAIALLQLYVFRRFDFTSMYVFRLIYYAYWHIIWGVLRLELLF